MDNSIIQKNSDESFFKDGISYEINSSILSIDNEKNNLQKRENK